jgi:adenine-specific DNA-methyltransferase
LETIALNDEPTVEGVAGLRPWRAKASDFCYRTRALKALSDLIAGLSAKRILLSYSGEGHVPIDDLHQNLGKIGVVETHALREVGRYRPNMVASAKHTSVREYLIVITKDLKPAVERPRKWQYERAETIRKSASGTY